MPIKRYNGSSWDVVAGAGVQGPAGASGNTTVNSKGDLLTFDTAAARLPVGTNGQSLIADSSTSTGLRWQDTFAAGKNAVINGGFDIWQRGTSFTSISNVGYTTDRWCVFTNSITGRDVSRQATSDTTNLPFIKYAARVGRASGNANTTNFFIGQSFESSASTQLAGKTVTISYYARAGANYSSASNVLNVYAGWGTGTDQNIFAGFTGQTSLGVSNGTLTTTWQRFTTTGTLGATATQFGLYFGYTPVGTAGAADYFEITGVQVEIGSVATPFQTATGTIQGELAACQRYYNGNTFAFRLSAGATNLANAITMYLPQMRTIPTLAFTAAASATNNISGTPTLDVLQSDTATYAARINFNASAANGDTFYVRAFSASAEL